MWHFMKNKYWKYLRVLKREKIHRKNFLNLIQSHPTHNLLHSQKTLQLMLKQKHKLKQLNMFKIKVLEDYTFSKDITKKSIKAPHMFTYADVLVYALQTTEKIEEKEARTFSNLCVSFYIYLFLYVDDKLMTCKKYIGWRHYWI